MFHISFSFKTSGSTTSVLTNSTVGLYTAAHPCMNTRRRRTKRHSFAVRTLIELHRSGADVGANIAVLSTYLGHVNPAGTYWYLSAAPELMELAAAHLDRRFGERS